MENHKVSIVIPYYNRWDLVHQLLYDIFKTCHDDVGEVLCVNDGSTEQDGCSFWGKGNLIPFTSIRIAKNMGFIAASNLGMSQANGDIKILISSDVRIYRPFIKDVISILDDNPKTVVGNMLRNYDTGWNKFGDQLFPYIEGWFIAVTAEAWDDIGRFDTRFMPNDYEDVDFSTSATSKGYSLVSLKNDGIVHIGAQTIGYNEQRMALTRENRDKFGEKWLKK